MEKSKLVIVGEEFFFVNVEKFKWEKFGLNVDKGTTGQGTCYSYILGGGRHQQGRTQGLDAMVLAHSPPYERTEKEGLFDGAPGWRWA